MVENFRNKTLRNYTIVIAIVAICSMGLNIYLCRRVLDTVDKITAERPKIYVVRDNITEELEVIEEKEAEIAEEVNEIKTTDEVIKENEEEIKAEIEPAEGVLTKQRGTVMFDGHKETYYNLPMKKVCENAKKRGIEGEYWEREEDGAKMFGDYIIVAADQKIHPYGSLVDTSLGTKGIVLDTGEFIKTNPEQIDIAVTW